MPILGPPHLLNLQERLVRAQVWESLLYLFQGGMLTGRVTVTPAGWRPFKAFLISAISTISKLVKVSPGMTSPAVSCDKWAIIPSVFTLLWLFFSHLWSDPGIYPFSLVQAPRFHSILSPHSERGVSQVAEKYLPRIPNTKSFLDSREGSSFTSPAHPVFLGLGHFWGPRILVFTMTFTEQLA